MVNYAGIYWYTFTRAYCDAPCIEQLKATHLRAPPKPTKTTGAVRCVASADKNVAAHNRSLKEATLVIDPFIPCNINFKPF